jgi:hypothetical protein
MATCYCWHQILWPECLGVESVCVCVCGEGGGAVSTAFCIPKKKWRNWTLFARTEHVVARQGRRVEQNVVQNDDNENNVK